ncbi:MAG: hypothetical protein HC929_08330 [Leptolyngbyaceae cyanobacterium SM2_5_2]|nr:hypothetical protein [Leptolyngbyaceae cyanobacterium SM2_5_2]
MLALISSPLRSTSRPRPDSLSPNQIGLDQQMTSRHSCPCCSSVLLRHIRHGNVYWRCSHCRAAMAVWAQL